jgi:hypothetical protein
MGNTWYNLEKVNMERGGGFDGPEEVSGSG